MLRNQLNPQKKQNKKNNKTQWLNYKNQNNNLQLQHNKNLKMIQNFKQL
jgi:hypothetical protein